MIRILIADDHAIVRKGLKHLLLEEYPTAVIDEVKDAESLIFKSVNNEWDVVICDMSMPGRSGLDALTQIKQTTPRLPVLIISMHPEDQYALRVLKAGASGYIGKDTVHNDLIKAVQTVLLGKKFITPSVAEKLANALNTDNNKSLHEKLSDREFEVFRLLASGMQVSEIAMKLSLSVTTVSTYRGRVLEKLGMKSNADITRYALGVGII
ncbi:MAG: response regulator transcription factor [Bacteroidetes bacterium]|nr:response regulator transcription factor [Bacteroidota bacterium]